MNNACLVRTYPPKSKHFLSKLKFRLALPYSYKQTGFLCLFSFVDYPTTTLVDAVFPTQKYFLRCLLVAHFDYINTIFCRIDAACIDAPPKKPPTGMTG